MENSINRLTLDELKKMKAFEVLEDERVKSRFISLYNTFHKSQDGFSAYEKERYHLGSLLDSDPELSQCTALSMYGVLIDLAVLGLTLEQGSQPLAYLLSFSATTGTEQNPTTERRALLEISPYGELALRIRSGQILYADRPVVVFQGDLFKPRIGENGLKSVLYECCVPRRSKEIIGCFIALTRPDHSRDYYWMLAPEIERLAQFSAKSNKQKEANPLYSSDQGQIDPGFLEAKTLKHSFKTFPKITLGQFSRLQLAEEETARIDYGLDAPILVSQVPINGASEILPKSEAKTVAPSLVEVEQEADIF